MASMPLALSGELMPATQLAVRWLTHSATLPYVIWLENPSVQLSRRAQMADASAAHASSTVSSSTALLELVLLEPLGSAASPTRGDAVMPPQPEARAATSATLDTLDRIIGRLLEDGQRMDAAEPQIRTPEFFWPDRARLAVFMVERAESASAKEARRRLEARITCLLGPTDPLTPAFDFSVAYTRYRPPIRAKCQRLLGASHSAEDVVQETFIRLWKSGLGEEADPRTVMAWLYRTCTRLAIDVLRERKRIDPREVADDDVPCGVDLAASTAARAVINKLATAVPEEELAVAILCRVDGLAQPEAAAVLDVSERTVRRMLERFDERTESLRKELSS